MEQPKIDDLPLLQSNGWPRDKANSRGRSQYRQTNVEYIIILWHITATIIMLLNLAISSRVIYESFVSDYKWGNHFSVMLISCMSFAAVVITYKLFIKRDIDV